mgnify:CR=1 FL=1
MQLTKNKLRQIIKEELTAILEQDEHDRDKTYGWPKKEPKKVKTAPAKITKKKVKVVGLDPCEKRDNFKDTMKTQGYTSDQDEKKLEKLEADCAASKTKVAQK